MFRYITHRFLVMIPTLLAVSALVFIIIQLPEGDFLTTLMAEFEGRLDPGEIEALRREYGLDKSPIEQYFIWLFGMLQGDFGWSFEHNRPVSELIGERLLLTFLVTFSTILFIWIVSFAIGTYVATRQYSFADNLATFIGYLGLATPNFLLALILMYLANQWFDLSIGGIMDDKFRNQPWSFAKFGSVLQHLWIPVIVIGTSGTAGMIRRLRANLLDELQKQYVVTGRAKGLHPRKLLWKYPLRVSLNPFIADIGSILPDVISGSAIVAVVLNLDITGRMLLDALRSQDMFLAGSFLMILSLFVVIGTLLSDLALAVLDPRIRLTGGNTR
ncbi:MAG: peptide/nickel transport system permease protein [Alphaproteobacteria bacterium]|jgi:peptide/nickel transport system permease protein